MCSIYRKKTLEGLNQVKGVIETLKKDINIIQGGVGLKIKKRKNVYHLVVISDFIFSEQDAMEIFDEVHKLYVTKNCKVVIMSLPMLVSFIKLSRFNKKPFWTSLEGRFAFSIANKTINIRDIDSSQAVNLPLIAPEEYVNLFKGD